MIIKSYSKAELAEMAGVSTDVFRQWINQPVILKALSKWNVKKTTKVLPPGAAQYVIDNYGIVVE